MVKIYSVGVWNATERAKPIGLASELKFTPLEFETVNQFPSFFKGELLKFTPLEFETTLSGGYEGAYENG